MNRQSGFTLIELAVIVAIIAIVSAIAIPNMIGSMANRRVNATARDIVSMIQKARIEAVRRNEITVVTFNAGGNYVAFVDDGGGVAANAGNAFQDAGERTLYSGALMNGVTIASVSLGLGGSTVSFNTRAMPILGGGPIQLTNNRGFTVTVTIGGGGIVRTT